MSEGGSPAEPQGNRTGASEVEFAGWPVVLGALLSGATLTSVEARAVMREVLGDRASPAQLSAFLMLLRSRTETAEELTGLSEAMAESATPFPIASDLQELLVDTCGTGGDRSGTINVSTASAIVAAAAGVPVCKHGNRASTSQTGSADVLEKLGVEIDLGPAEVLTCIESTNIGFCLARRYHPAMKFAVPTRRELGVPTAFNLLGPLANPAGVKRQVIGVSAPTYAEKMLVTLQLRGATRAMVVFGHDGLDELTTTTTSTIFELDNGRVERYDIDPADYGIEYCDPASLRGGSPGENAARIRRILENEAGAQADIVALNAAAALRVGGRVDSIGDGVELARSTIADGKAGANLEEFARISKSF